MAARLPGAAPSTPPPSTPAPAEVVLRAETALSAAVRPVSASCVTDSKIPAPPPSASASPPLAPEPLAMAVLPVTVVLASEEMPSPRACASPPPAVVALTELFLTALSVTVRVPPSALKTPPPATVAAPCTVVAVPEPPLILTPLMVVVTAGFTVMTLPKSERQCWSPR